MSLAVVILTFNEERHIAAAIKSALQVTDEIIVIDSGSADKTIEIAKQYGARIFSRAWDNDFSAQRNFASDKTSARWLLHLDADERLSETLAAEIKKAIEGPERLYYLTRFNVVLGQKMLWGAYRPDKIRRLYPRERAFWQGKVHEGLKSELPEKSLSGEMLHYTVYDWEEYFNKFNSYTTIWAKEAYAQNKRTSLPAALAHAFFAFLKTTLIYGGLLDGAMGVALCYTSSTYTLTKYLKLLRLQISEIAIPKPGERVLWMCFGAFGDVMENLANARIFKRRFPEVHLSFLSVPEVAPLLRKQPYLDEVVEGSRRPVRVFLSTLRKMRNGSYNWLINNWHTGWHPYILSRFSGIPHKAGEAPFSFLNKTYEFSAKYAFDVWNLDISDRSSAVISVDSLDKEEAANLLKDLPRRRVFALIGASRLRKMWPTRHWIEFLSALVAEGWGVALNGHGRLESEIGRDIEKALQSPRLLNLVDRLDFCQMAAISQNCSVAIGNDTGPLHLAALGGVPTIGLFARHTSQDVDLRMPWFMEVCAEEQRESNDDPATLMASLSAEFVLKRFHSFMRETEVSQPL
ncbi:hypothetical protein AGMMS49957_11710 [Synergistales bacterium]|nr:hypothetical protein AGMMS49957_11710 [Synergistales bacterium]